MSFTRSFVLRGGTSQICLKEMCRGSNLKKGHLSELSCSGVGLTLQWKVLDVHRGWDVVHCICG